MMQIETISSPSSFAPTRPADVTATRAALISPVVLAGFVRVLEGVMIAALGAGIAALYVDTDMTVLLRYGLTSVVAGGLTAILLSAFGLHAVQTYLNPMRTLPRLIGGWALAAVAVISTVFFLKLGMGFSRVWLATWFVACAAGLGAGRFALAAQARSWSKAGRLNRRAVIYGSGPTCAALVQALEADGNSDIHICGIFDDRGGDRAGTNTAGYPNRGRLDDLMNFARSSRVDLVLLAAENRLTDLLQRLWVLPADIRLAASASRLKLARRAYAYVGNVALIALADKPISDWGTIAKSVFDKVVAVLALRACLESC